MLLLDFFEGFTIYWHLAVERGKLLTLNQVEGIMLLSL